MEMLITIIGVVVAIYAVIPRERQLSLMVKMGTLDWFWFVCVALFLSTIYLSYYSFFEARGWAVSCRKWPAGITPANSVPLLLLLGLVCLGLRVKFSRLSRRRISRFRELAEELLWSGATAELLALFQESVREFFKIYGGDFWLLRMRSRLSHRVSPTFEDIAFACEAGAPIRDLSPPLRKLALLMIRCLPTYERELDEAAQVARSVLLAQPFVAALVRSRPYLGLTIVDLWSWAKYEQEEFLSLYMRELLELRTSVFYAEIVGSQEMTSNYRYKLSPSRRLLHYFLSDARVARELSVWKPVRDFALRELDRLAREPENDPNNQPPEADFEERGCWHSPIFGVIRFFDIMVTEALFQGIEWHMWLYYFPAMVRQMVRNCRPSESMDIAESQWPTTYHRLMDEIFSALCNWVKAIKDVPASQTNVVLQNADTGHENGNIPKSSLLALSRCVETVVLSDNLSDKFKIEVLDKVFELFFHLRQLNDRPGYATVLGAALRSGGPALASPSQQYGDFLRDAFNTKGDMYRDRHSRQDVSALEQALA